MPFFDTYCSTKLAKKFGGSTEGTEDDDLFSACILAASRMVEDYTGRYYGASAFVSGERVRTIMGIQHNIFYTQLVPIISVTLILDDLKTYVEGQDFVVFQPEGRVELYSLTNAPNFISYYSPSMGIPASFSRKPGALQCSYNVGQGPSPSGSSSGAYLQAVVPYQVQLATAIIAGHFYKEPDRVGIASQSKGGDSITYLQDLIPKKAQSLLNPLIRHIF